VAAPAKNVRELLARRWGVTLANRANEMLSVVPAALVTILRGDPNRTAFLLVNQGGFIVFAAPAGIGLDPRSGQGVRVDPNGGSLALLWEEDGEMVSWEWLATASGGNTAVSIIETRIEVGQVPP